MIKQLAKKFNAKIPTRTQRNPKRRQNATLVEALGSDFSAFGLNIMVNTGVVSSSVVQKINAMKQNPQAARLLQLVQSGVQDQARLLSLNKSFISQNKKFVQGGSLLRRTIQNRMFTFSMELLNSGYSLNKGILLDSIKEGNFNLTRDLLINNFLPNQNYILELWFLLHLKRFDLALIMIQNNPEIQEIVRNYDINTSSGVSKFLNDQTVVQNALCNALQRKQDKLSCSLLSHNPQAITSKIIILALNNSCISFLKVVWTGNYKVKQVSSIKNRLKRSEIWTKLGKDLVDYSQRKQLAKALKIPYIIQLLLQTNKFTQIRQVLAWPDASKQRGVIKTLISNDQQSLARYALNFCTSGVGPQDFNTAFEAKLYTLCVDMLKFKQTQSVLDQETLQSELIELLKNGESCLQAMEMLTIIPIKIWNMELTKPLCSTLMALAKNKSQLIVCSGPILFCVLTAEFLNRLAESSFQHQNRCLGVSQAYIQLGICIQNSIKQEDILKYYMLQKDSNGRPVLSIISKNRFYPLLENDQVGSIVNKLWMGPIQHNGFFNASTLYQSYRSQSGTQQSLAFMKRMDRSRPYLFQCQQWLQSCGLRFLGQASSTVLFLINYNLLVYYTIQQDTFLNVADNERTVYYLRISQVWVIGIMVQQFLTFVFGQKTARGYQLDNFRVLDLIMFCTMIFLAIGIHQNLRDEGLINLQEAKLFNACMHSTMMVIIWLRFISVLVSSKNWGPFIRMIYMMIKETLSFIILFFGLMLCFSAIFTSLFNDTAPKYATFTISMRTLYSSAIGVFDFTAFAGSSNQALGGILLGLYLLVANVLLLNLLIALLSSIYSQVITRVDSEHRAVVIAYYDRFFWDTKYGILIFLASPLTYLVLLFSPFVLYSQKAEKYNTQLVKVCFLFYAFPLFFMFFGFSLFMVILMYIKGFWVYGKSYKKNLYCGHSIRAQEIQDYYSVTFQFKVYKTILWTVIGIPYLLWVVLRDSYDFWASLYDQHDIIQQTDMTRAQKLVTPKFIENIQFIIREVQTKQLTINQLVEFWIQIQQAGSFLSESDLQDKKKLGIQFFLQFSTSIKKPIVDMKLMKRLLPVQKFYNEEYIQKVQHINLPWLVKGLKEYQRKVGSLVLGTLTIPKEISTSRGALDAFHFERIRIQIKELHKRYTEVNKFTTAILTMIRQQKEAAKVINSANKVN